MPDKPKILVVDQDPQGCAEIQHLLAGSPVIVIGGVGFDEEALSIASELKPHAIFVALEEPTGFPLQTLRALSGLLPETQIFAYSSLNDVQSTRQAKALGALEYLTKPLSREKLTDCIARATSGATEPANTRAESSSDRRSGMVITIFGTKGGIGRTLIAINLAASMAKSGLVPVLVDLDPSSSDVARRMKIRADNDLVGAARNAAELDEITVDSYLNQHASGVKILPAPPQPTDWREIDPGAVNSLITILAKVHEFVIIDTPAAFTDLSMLAAHRANTVLLLTSLDPSSIESTAMAFSMLDASRSGSAKTRLVLNHLAPGGLLRDDDAARKLNHEAYSSLPYDGSIVYGDEAGRPAVISRPKAKISRAISKMASLLAEARVPASDGPVRGPTSSLFGRLLGARKAQ